MLPPKNTNRPNGYKNKTCCLQKTHRSRNTYRPKLRGGKRVFHTNRNQKKAREAILLSDKIGLKIKDCYERQRRIQHMINGSIQGDTTLANIYAPKRRAPQHIYGKY